MATDEFGGTIISPAAKSGGGFDEFGGRLITPAEAPPEAPQPVVRKFSSIEIPAAVGMRPTLIGLRVAKKWKAAKIGDTIEDDLLKAPITKVSQSEFVSEGMDAREREIESKLMESGPVKAAIQAGILDVPSALAALRAMGTTSKVTRGIPNPVARYGLPVVAGVGAAIGTRTVQDEITEGVAPQFAAQARKDFQDNPTASTAGALMSSAPLFSVGRVAKGVGTDILSRLFSAGVGGGVQTGAELSAAPEGQLMGEGAGKRIPMAAGINFFLNKPTKLGERVMGTTPTSIIAKIDAGQKGTLAETNAAANVIAKGDAGAGPARPPATTETPTVTPEVVAAPAKTRPLPDEAIITSQTVDTPSGTKSFISIEIPGSGNRPAFSGDPASAKAAGYDVDLPAQLMTGQRKYSEIRKNPDAFTPPKPKDAEGRRVDVDDEDAIEAAAQAQRAAGEAPKRDIKDFERLVDAYLATGEELGAAIRLGKPAQQIRAAEAKARKAESEFDAYMEAGRKIREAQEAAVRPLEAAPPPTTPAGPEIPAMATESPLAAAPRSGQIVPPPPTELAKTPSAIKITPESPPPVSDRAIAQVDNALNFGAKLTPDEIAGLPLVERRFFDEFPEFANPEGLILLRERTRGVITDQEALEAAKRLGWTEARVRALRPGSILNAENQLAVDGVVAGAARRLRAMQEAVKMRDLDAGSAEFAAMNRRLAEEGVRNYQLQQIYRGLRSEAGRTLQKGKVNVDPSDDVTSQFLAAIESVETSPAAKETLVTLLANWDGKNPDDMLRILRFARDSTFMEKAVELATSMKLWGKQTFQVNLFTSMARQFMMIADTGAAAIGDAAYSLATGKQRDRFLSEVFAEAYGQILGYKAVPYHLKRLIQDESYALEMRSAADFFGTKAPAWRGRFGRNTIYDKAMDVSGELMRLSFRGLSVGDIVVRSPVEQGALMRVAVRNALKKGHKFGTEEFSRSVDEFVRNPTADILAYIKGEGNRSLFQRDAQNKMLQGFAKMRQESPALKLFVPFYRTLNDVVKTAIEYSPGTFILKSSRTQLKKDKGEAAEVLGRVMMGSALMFYIYNSAELTLDAPKDPAERDAWVRQGKTPYSIKLGDQWVAYNRMSPFAQWFTTAAIVQDHLEKKEEDPARSIMADFVFGNVRSLADQTFMTGLSDLLEAVQDDSPAREKAKRWATSFLVGATYPNLLAEEARAIDPIRRDVRDPQGTWIQSITGDEAKESPVTAFFARLEAEYMRRTPYKSQYLPAQTTVFGEPIRHPGSSYLERSWNPIKVSKITQTIVDRELEAIKYKVGFPSRKQLGFEITEQQYRDLKNLTGQMSYNVLDVVVQNPAWEALTPRTKEQLVNQILGMARVTARAAVAPETITKNAVAKMLMEEVGVLSQDAVKEVEAIASGEKTLEQFLEEQRRLLSP